MHRRQFVAAAVSLAAGRRLLAQGEVQGTSSDTTQSQSAASNMVMNQSAIRPVRLPVKPGARPVLTTQQRDDLEHRIHCQCGCTLDVFTCRTTDFSCSVSPAMHGDVQRLVEGGYSADEIVAAFTDVYGERVLMVPKKEGFNWAGYVAPFVAIGTAGAVVATTLRRWRARAAVVTPASRGDVQADVDATPEELARLDAAVRAEEA
ncbi:cytochrome C biogenesis protein [Gemmatirosa kalamazoonensis]|uniref:Cytochrome c-type biogenesis protein n=1 Tax=Gemmatirosa kalamazoonensis TaxID=861299 RepID=W0RIX8_9BACT|nr:cytochrome c-type biogenesis protein CcmH [Gemmatirosa kalamazoonensis]AHG90280.1 cytochrome C biogenesis protein [Gemmatirosa kalamazoonensis]